MEMIVGESGVERRLPLILGEPSYGGGQTPLSLGCSGFKIEAMARCPFRASGIRPRCDCCNGDSVIIIAIAGGKRVVNQFE